MKEGWTLVFSNLNQIYYLKWEDAVVTLLKEMFYPAVISCPRWWTSAITWTLMSHLQEKKTQKLKLLKKSYRQNDRRYIFWIFCSWTEPFSVLSEVRPRSYELTPKSSYRGWIEIQMRQDFLWDDYYWIWMITTFFITLFCLFWIFFNGFN